MKKLLFVVMAALAITACSSTPKDTPIELVFGRWTDSETHAILTQAGDMHYNLTLWWYDEAGLGSYEERSISGTPEELADCLAFEGVADEIILGGRTWCLHEGADIDPKGFSVMAPDGSTVGWDDCLECFYLDLIENWRVSTFYR